MKHFVLLLLSLGILSDPALSAPPDTLTNSRMVEQPYIKTTAYFLPSALFLSGLFINYADDKKFKQQFQLWIRSGHSDFHTDVDDYLQWAPVGELIISGLAGAEARHQPIDQGRYALISILTTSLVTRGLKEGIGETRPNGGMHSFPSGHTSNAFTGATILYFEYRDTKPLLAWSGYLFATATGVLRIYNNAHWVSDVLAGAGLGILIPQIVYRIEPLKNWHPFPKKREQTKLSFVPVTGRYTGMFVKLRF